MAGRINRREFIKWSAAAGTTIGAGLNLKARASTFSSDRDDSPNGRITLGFIGVGARAHDVMSDVVKMPGFEVVAVCDAYQGRLERALERTGGRAKVYKDHRELLAAPGIDAVYIGTPDHWHKDHAIAALNAGKDVYIEKPLTYTIDEGLEIIAAVKKSGRILQVGSQNISLPAQARAKEIIESGRLGQITMIRSSTNRNTAGGAWIYPIPPDASEQTVNWEMFSGPSRKHSFSLERFFRWRCYKDYSGGIATDLYVHTMTTIHYLMGVQAPDTVFAAGDLYRWKESRDVPDTINAILQYPEGFTVNLSATFNNQSASERSMEILGTKGTLSIGRDLTFTPENPIEDNSWIVESWPQKLQDAYYKDPKVRAAEVPQSWDPKVIQTEEVWRGVGRNSTVLHFENFQRAVKDRKQPVEDVLAGHRAAAVAHMINLSAAQKRPIQWDRSRDKVKA
ncbi:MAG TPA: Gfo/Idh/MocA family oxidoreductase [Blastocatellia bacterium]|nr:Gfo/Idh/MocA family oxidoreductase [Blastocatellia bacterium]